MLSVAVWWLSLAVPAADPAAPLALVHVTLIDGSGSAPQTDMTVIIEDLIKMLDGIGNGYRRGRYPDAKTSTKIATVLRAVADELEL